MPGREAGALANESQHSAMLASSGQLAPLYEQLTTACASLGSAAQQAAAALETSMQATGILMVVRSNNRSNHCDSHSTQFE